MKRISLIVAVVFVGVLAPAVSAQSFPGGAIDPGDNVVAGATNMVTVTGVPSLSGLRVEVDVTWSTRHTWVGDVILSLTGPATGPVTIDLLRRPGRSDNTAGAGASDSSNFLGTYTFRDLAINRIIDIANITGAADDATGDVPTLTPYRATNNIFNLNGTPTFTGEQIQTLDTSFGTVGNGDWTLLYADAAGGDYSPVSGWVLRFVPVPEPTSVLAVGAGVVGLGGLIRRRMRRPVVVA